MALFLSFGDLESRSREEREKKRQALICEHIPYVKAMVNRLSWRLPPHVELDDLINAGIVGLIQAVDSYDPARQTKLVTYAQYRIQGAILSELRARDYLSRTDRKKIREMEKAYEVLEREGRDEITDEALAMQMGIDLSEFHEIKGLSSISFVSAEEMSFAMDGADWEEKIPEWAANREGDGFTHLRLQEVHKALTEALDRLSEKERLVLSLYYTDELTLKEIGAVLELTESRVSQIRSQALARLRRTLRKEDILEK